VLELTASEPRACGYRAYARFEVIELKVGRFKPEFTSDLTATQRMAHLTHVESPSDRKELTLTSS
jgi:hypothetical protein